MVNKEHSHLLLRTVPSVSEAVGEGVTQGNPLLLNEAVETPDGAHLRVQQQLHQT